VIYRLLGKPQLAEQALDAELRADESEAGDSYRRFVEHFMRTTPHRTRLRECALRPVVSDRSRK